jgi:tetratricopeptide (TPR) repeat protein
MTTFGVAGALILIGPAASIANRSADVASPLPSHTVHPPVARNASELWMAPSASDRGAVNAHPALTHLQAALRLYADGKYDDAFTRFSAAAASKSPLRSYAAYYAAVCELRLRRFESAKRHFAALRDTEGFVGEAAALGEADAAQSLGAFDDAVKVYEDILDEAAVDVPAIWLSLATAAQAAGDRRRAAEAYLHLYYEFPLSEHAAQAEAALQTLPDVQQIATGNTRYKLEMGRGERLFGSRRYTDARTSFLRLKPYATSEQDAELVALRLAEVDYFQERYSDARDALRPFLTKGARQAEARFFYLMSQRGLGNDVMFIELAGALERDFPESTWTEEALNHLATFYILHDRDMMRRMPCFGGCTNDFLAGDTQSAPRGKPDGTPIVRVR